MEQPVEPIPPVCESGARRGELFGGGDVDLEHIWFDGKLAGGPLGKRESTPCSRKNHLSSFFLCQLGHGEGEGGLGEDAGDEEVFASEKSHVVREVMRQWGHARGDTWRNRSSRPGPGRSIGGVRISGHPGIS